MQRILKILFRVFEPQSYWRLRFRKRVDQQMPQNFQIYYEFSLLSQKNVNSFAPPEAQSPLEGEEEENGIGIQGEDFQDVLQSDGFPQRPAALEQH